MRKLLPLLLLLVGCGGANVVTSTPPPVNADWTITLSFNYDFTNYVPCSASVTKGCISTFTWGYMQGTTQMPLKTSPASVCAGATQPEACIDTANSTLGIGSVVPYAIANGFDNSGNAISSTTANGPGTTVPIGVPGAVAMTIK